MAKTVPPKRFPNTTAEHGTGATKMPWRKPSRRSSIMEIVEKIAVKSKIITSVPGKKKRMYDSAPLPPKLMLRPIPPPISNQNTIGVASAPMIRCLCRKNLTNSRFASEIAGRNSPPERAASLRC